MSSRRCKYIRSSVRSGEPIGVCDRSGAVFNHRDLVKQMEWRGDNLVWTGLLVGRPFLYTPNEQERPPVIKADPEVVKNPRPRTPYINNDYPVSPGYKVIQEELTREGFYTQPPPPQQPGKVPGYVEPNPLPPYPVVIKELNKIRFSS